MAVSGQRVCFWHLADADLRAEHSAVDLLGYCERVINLDSKIAVCTENLNPGVLVMESTEDWE